MSNATIAPYRCTECGYQSLKWVGRCPECQSWGTVVETGTRTGIPRRSASTGPSVAFIDDDRRAVPIADVPVDAAKHVSTGIGEFDRVLGGGIVPGAAVLVSGEPGVGKSTLLLEAAARWAQRSGTVLYLTAEESAAQVRLRAERIGAVADSLLLAAETDLDSALGQIQATEPSLAIIDSVQTLHDPASDGIPGGTTQVRSVANALTKAAKSLGVPMILVGHVTKDGTVAGPRLLEHLVDVVCQFEGDQQTALRFLRTLKNRYGSTDEVGCFEMTGTGMHEVPDPSGLFLSPGDHVAGTVVTIAMEGRRALPVEVQALVVPSTAPQPRRVTNGVDPSRLSMLLAVLQRRAGLSLADHEVYVSTVGGVKLTEPAADLAIALAVASAATGHVIGAGIAAFGEISLAGQIRPTSNSAQRTAEARRLGSSTIIDSGAGHLRTALDALLRRGGTGASLNREVHRG